MWNKVRKYSTGLIFLSPSLAGVLIFVMFPFADVVKRSFTTAVTGEWNGIENYKLVYENKAFLLAVENTLRFTGVCLPLLLGIGLFVAVRLSKLKYIAALKSCFLFPMAMPAATVVFIWKMVFYRQGFLNGFLTKLAAVTGWALPGMTEGGIILTDYMGTEASFFVLVFSYLWKNLGYMVILWLAGIMSVSTDIVEAAKVDGAGEFCCFWRIVFPCLKGSLYTITVLSFLNSFKVFREAYLVAGSYPNESMYLLQHLFNNWFTNLEFDKMAAAAVTIAAVLFGFILLLQRMWDKEEES